MWAGTRPGLAGLAGAAVAGAALSGVAVPMLAAVAGPAPDRGRAGFTQRAVVPAYLDPGLAPGEWDRLAGRPQVGVLVVNASSGPGMVASTVWQRRITQAHAAGQRVLGYVDTGYLGTTGALTGDGAAGQAAWLGQAREEVSRWFRLYQNLDGIFLDRMTSACGPVPGSTAWSASYHRLTVTIKRAHPGAFVLANPGAPVPRCYEQSADTLVTFEGDYATYSSRRYVPLGWIPADPGKICHLVHGVTTAADLSRSLGLSRQRGAGYVYATPGRMPNPWGSVPPADFWARELDQLATPAGRS